MASFTLNINNIEMQGPLIEVAFTPSSAARQALSISGVVLPRPISVQAMVDTGATTTVVTPKIARPLGLNPVSQVPIRTPTTQQPVMANQYSVDLHFPINGVVVPDIVVSEAGLIGQHIECLIGRDVLRLGVLVYIGYNNQFTLSF